MPPYHKFDPNCPHCKPAMINPKTGKVYDAFSPEMLAINAVWELTSREVQEAYINITAHNSRSRKDLELADEFILRVTLILEQKGPLN